MYNSEYVFIYKDELMDWPMKVSAAWHLWIYLRMSVASKNEFQAVGSTNSVESVSFGQIVTSKQFLASQLHLTTRTINKYLRLLAEDGHIVLEEEKKFIRITIPNYERFYSSSNTLKNECTTNSIGNQPNSAPANVQITQPLTMHSIVHSTEQHPQKPAFSIPQNSPESPIVVEEDKKKENNNNSTTTSSTRGEDFFERFRNSPSQLEVVRKQMGLKTVDEVLEKLEFFEIWINGENKQHTSYGDFITHFTSWHRKYSTEKSSKSSAPKHGGGQSAHSEKPSGWRDNLGTDTKAKCAKDYEEPI